MSMKQSSLQAFPITKNTFQGIASNMNYDKDIYYHMVMKTLDDTDITITYDGGTVSLTGILAGNDFILPGNTGVLTTTGAVLIS